MRSAASTLAILFSVAGALSCGGADDPSPNGDDTGDALPPEPETICDDGLDDDGDGLIDCEDDDCAAEFHCTWPDQIDNDVDIQFEPSTLAEFAGYEACTIRTHSVLANDDDSACPTCDRSYTGDLVYDVDTCPADAGERPASVTYGLDFLSETERMFSGEEDGVWVEIATATASKDGAYRYTVSETLEAKGLDLGDVTIALTFTDR